MHQPEIILCICIFFLSMFYSSVGNGGGTGFYLLFTFAAIPSESILFLTAYISFFVGFVAFLQFYTQGHFRWNLFWPFALTCVPSVFLGSFLSLQYAGFRIVLAVLFTAVVFLLLSSIRKAKQIVPVNIYLSMLLGLLVGCLSPSYGIGAGIIFSSVIVLLRWGTIKEAAAACALLILLNSVSSITAHLSQGYFFNTSVFIWIVSAILGGSVGSYLGSRILHQNIMKVILAIIISTMIWRVSMAVFS